MSNAGEVERFFDDIAPRYPSIIGSNGWPANDMLCEELVANPQRVDLALDLGAGTGLSTDAIVRGANPRHIIAADISRAMLEQLSHPHTQHPEIVIARMAIDRFMAGFQSVFEGERLRNRSNSDPRLIVSRWAMGRFFAHPHTRFDLITAIGLLHFLPNPQSVISSVARILNGRGRFIFTYDPFIAEHPIHGEAQTTYNLTVYRSAPVDIEDALRRNGLGVVSDRPFVPQPNGNTEYQARFVVARKSSHSHLPRAQE
jgi:predicted TPR repeat methyltransferase